MNTSLAIILTIVVTNWTHIGNFKDTSGKTFDVQEGRIQTNTVVDVYWNEIAPEPIVPNRIMNRRFGSTNRFVLKSVDGAIADRRLIEITNAYATNIWTMTNFSNPWNFLPTNSIIYNSNHYPTNSKYAGIPTNIYWWQNGRKAYSIPAIKLED